MLPRLRSSRRSEGAICPKGAFKLRDQAENSFEINTYTISSELVLTWLFLASIIDYMKAHAYLRVSGKGQIEGDGFPRQLKAVREHAAAHDIQIVRVFREEGVSGTTDSVDRPAWSELMTVLHSNGVRTIIIERLDRLARDLMVQETIIADLQKN